MMKITPVAGDLMCSSDLQGYLAPTWCTYLHADKTIIHIISLDLKRTKEE